MTKIPKYSGIVKSDPPSQNGSAVSETPYKYNGGYNYTERTNPSHTPYTIAVDWLSLTCTGFLFHSANKAPDVLNFGNVELSRMKGGTSHYTYRYQVKVNGEPFAVLLTTPRTGGALEANRPDFNELKIENHILYRQGWQDVLQDVLQATGLGFYHITRLDIALDGYRMLNIFERHQRGELRKIGRAKYSHHYDSKGTLSGVDWGSRSSDKHLTAYQVGKRVEVENKAYRAEFWQANGLNDVEAVERLELKLKADAVKQIVQSETGEIGISFAQLDSPRFLAGIMQAQFSKWLEFRIPDPLQKNVSRLKKANVIDWALLDSVQMERLRTTKKPNAVWSAKRCASKLLEDNGKEYIPRAIKGYLVEHGDRAINKDAWLKAEQSVIQYLRINHPYMIPAGIISGMVDVLRQSVGKEYARQLNDDVLSDLPRRIAYAVAHQHGAGAWLNRKDLNRTIRL
jgi:hypothetical protein